MLYKDYIIRIEQEEPNRFFAAISRRDGRHIRALVADGEEFKRVIKARVQPTAALAEEAARDAIDGGGIEVKS